MKVTLLSSCVACLLASLACLRCLLACGNCLLASLACLRCLLACRPRRPFGKPTHSCEARGSTGTDRCSAA
eukprot:scaffold4197_cov199-Pinguiococcus_pyrenoidosus.AAC.1